MKSAWVGLLDREGNEGDLPAPRLIAVPRPVKASIVTANSATIVTDQGKVWRCAQDWTPRLLDLPVEVKALACAPSATFIVSTTGKVYVWGSDPAQSGLLGLSSVFTSDSPILISALSQAIIVQIAAGVQHAAAIDSTSHLETGKAYTWGSGQVGELGGPSYSESQTLPHVLDSTRAFTVRKVLCGTCSTAILTIGGFLYFFGHLGSLHACHLRPPNRPKAPSHLEDLYAADICLAPGLLALASEGGAVYAVDDCLELVQLPSLPDTKVTFLSATSTSLYGLTSEMYAENGGLLQRWTNVCQSPTELKALQAVIAADQLSCSLYAWKSVAYSLDEPWDACSGLGQSQGPCLPLHLPAMDTNTDRKGLLGLHIGEIPHSRIVNLTTEISAIIGTDQPDFKHALVAYFTQIQVRRIEKGLKTPLRRQFTEVLKAVQAAKGLARQRKRLMAMVQAALETEKLRKRMLKDRLFVAFEGIQVYGEWVFKRKMRKKEGLEVFFRLFVTISTAKETLAVFQSFSQLKAVYTLCKQQKSAISRLNGLYLTHLSYLQSLSLRKWRESVVRQGIKRWATGKLAKAFRRVLAAQAWFSLLSALTRWREILTYMEKLLRRRGREARREALGRRFAVWKALAMEGVMQRIARLQEVRVSARALAHVCRRILRAQQYFPAFQQIQRFARGLSQANTLLHPILLLTSLYEKLHAKAYRWAFNTLSRFDREKTRERDKERIRALAKMGLGTLKNAFGEWIELARRMKKHPIISFTYWFLRAIDKIQHRHLAYGLSRLDILSHALGHSSEDSLVLLGESQEGPFTLLSQSPTTSLSSRSNTYFSPDESAPFLAKELDFEDSGARPVELGFTSKDSTQIGSPKILYRKMPSVRSSPNQSGSGQTRPPWRAPSRSGLSKLPSGLAIDRRRAYDNMIKMRQSQSRLRLHSPSALQSPTKAQEEDILELQYQHFERNMARARTLASPRSSANSMVFSLADPNSLRLRLIMFIRNLQKSYLKRVSLGWVAIQHPPYMHYVRFVKPAQVAVQEDSEEENEDLESSWKRRLMLVAAQRLSKALSGRVVSLLSAFSRLRVFSSVL